MKCLAWLSLAALLALGGCATVAPDPTAAPAPPVAVAEPATGSATTAAPAAPTQPTTPSGRTAMAGGAGASAAAAPPPPPYVPTGPLSPIRAEEVAPQPVANLQPPSDLWQRIRSGFAMPDFESDLVRHHEQWYASRPDYIQRMTDRANKYLFHIVEEIERRNMPAELALLPFIESAFNPRAVSSARAAGMWQFMPATGRDFDLKQNVFRDDRRDVLASTRAALDYLQRLHGMFGDWHLALAAYNWGEGSVGRAIARNQRAGLGTSYADLNMPNETRNYVPKLQAIKNIVARPAAFNAQLPVIENHPYFDTVAVERDIDVDLAARLAEVDLDDFKALNPQHNRPVILAAGTPEILLPWDNAKVFRRNHAAHGDAPFASWTAWRAPATMTAAAAAKRVGMSEAQLRAVNAIPPRMLIRVGSVLIVPRSERTQNDVAGHVADNGQLSLTPEVVTRRLVVRAGKQDTVASIARRYRVSAANVARWNKVGVSAKFAAGQRVIVYATVRATPRKTSSARAVPSRAVKRAAARR